MTHQQFRRAVAASAAAAFLAIATSQAFAQWTQYDVPAMANNGFFAPIPVVGHLSDGRFLYGQGGRLFLQDAWGQSNATAFANAPTSADPSFIAIFNASMGALGSGGWGASPILTFNPGNTSSSIASSATVQNYAGVFRDASSLFVNGVSTSNEVSYLTLDGSINKVIVRNVSLYSAGLARDAAGNLYVGNNDNGGVYKFTSIQLDAAISGASLNIGDGTLVHDFGDGGNISSLAVDGLGRLWAGGWATTGIKVFDPGTSQESTFVPGLSNQNYYISTFTKDAASYISYVNNAGWNVGDAVTYGIAVAAAVPEPGVIVLVGTGLAALFLHCRHRA